MASVFGTGSSPVRGCKPMAEKTLRLLIADAHPLVRRGLRSLLATHEGWEVCGEAGTGSETVQMVKQLRPDMVITDISMPEMNGFDAIRQIHAIDPNVGILMLTMHDSETMLRGAMEAGAHGYVLKSDLDNRLIDAVEAMCEGRAFFSPGISQTVMKNFIRGGHPGTQDPNVLTPRQREVLKLLASGKSNKEVASELGISTPTAVTHRLQIMNRLKVHTLSEMVLFAVRNHLIDV